MLEMEVVNQLLAGVSLAKKYVSCEYLNPWCNHHVMS
jgi:hypothetical protein